MDKTIRIAPDPEQQRRETYLYWQSRPVGERLAAVCEVSTTAYALKAAFTGVPYDDAQRLPRTLVRIQRPQR
jgi:hypothetical protein